MESGTGVRIILEKGIMFKHNASDRRVMGMESKNKFNPIRGGGRTLRVSQGIEARQVAHTEPSG